MLIKLAGARVIDPGNGVNGEVRDIFIRDGRVVADPGTKPDRIHDLTNKIVMAGAIDMHTHIGGGKVTIARTLLPEEHRRVQRPRKNGRRAGTGDATATTFMTGYRYAEMGYTAAFEPAMVPATPVRRISRWATSPIVDKGAYVMLGNDDFLLRALAGNKRRTSSRTTSPGPCMRPRRSRSRSSIRAAFRAFKFNQRSLDLDESTSYYGITPRKIIQTLARGGS